MARSGPGRPGEARPLLAFTISLFIGALSVERERSRRRRARHRGLRTVPLFARPCAIAPGSPSARHAVSSSSSGCSPATVIAVTGCGCANTPTTSPPHRDRAIIVYFLVRAHAAVTHASLSRSPSTLGLSSRQAPCMPRRPLGWTQSWAASAPDRTFIVLPVWPDPPLDRGARSPLSDVWLFVRISASRWSLRGSRWLDELHPVTCPSRRARSRPRCFCLRAPQAGGEGRPRSAGRVFAASCRGAVMFVPHRHDVAAAIHRAASRRRPDALWDDARLFALVTTGMPGRGVPGDVACAPLRLPRRCASRSFSRLPAGRELVETRPWAGLLPWRPCSVDRRRRPHSHRWLRGPATAPSGGLRDNRDRRRGAVNRS